VNLSRTPSRVVSAPPDLGEHTAQVLRELGFDAAQIERLAEQGIV
jgi:formyl-CoA transferase